MFQRFIRPNQRKPEMARAWSDGWLAGFADHDRPLGQPKTPNPYASTTDTDNDGS